MVTISVIIGIVVGFILGCKTCYINHPELHEMAEKKARDLKNRRIQSSRTEDVKCLKMKNCKVE